MPSSSKRWLFRDAPGQSQAGGEGEVRFGEQASILLTVGLSASA